MLIKIADPVIELVEAPILYNTPIDVVGSLDSAQRVVEMLRYLQGCRDLEQMLKMDRWLVVFPVFERLVMNYLPTFTQSKAREWARHLLSHTRNYDRFMNSKPEFSVKSSGKKWRVNGGSLLFDTKQQAVNFHIEHSVNWKKYEIVEGV